VIETDSSWNKGRMSLLAPIQLQSGQFWARTGRESGRRSCQSV